MKKIPAFFFAFFLVFALHGQQNLLKAIEGNWLGDKALGMLSLSADGTGELTFEGNSEVAMKVKMTRENGKLLVLQDEANRPEFYLAFNKFFSSFQLTMPDAAQVAEKARPMKWVFSLSEDGKKLTGTKYTSALSKDGKDVEVDNTYERESEWTRLSGQVAQVAIGATVSGKGKKAAVRVELSTKTAGAQIRYTLDGTPPAPDTGIVYKGPITDIKENCTIKALAFKPGWQNSKLAAQTILIPAEPSAPAGKGIVKEHDQWKFEIKDVTRKDGTVRIDFLVTNLKDETRTLTLYDTCRILDASGNEYKNTKIIVSTREGKGWSAGDFISAIPLKASLFFKAPPESETLITALDINNGWFYINSIPLP